jgi:Leucine-rich repeat (LRR) protein
MLGGNRFKTIPASLFRNLGKLTFLDFYAQQDIVSVPLDVFDPLTSLEKLYIADIKLTEDELALGLLKGPARSLQHLSLGNNRIARLPGAAFKDMDKLTTLSLATNKITEV